MLYFLLQFPIYYSHKSLSHFKGCENKKGA
jgi:hypothetical protein